MGRRSLVEERTEQILDAFGRCVARFGLEGSSLERIAEEAAMKRSILRHYVGNREDLINALAIRVVTKYRTEFLDSLDFAGSKKGVKKWLVSYLFPDDGHSNTEELLIIEALIGAAGTYPNVRKLVTAYVDDVVKGISQILSSAYPEVKPKRCWDVAYGLVCIVFNNDSLAPLKLPAEYLRAAKVSSELLIDSLAE